MFTTLKKLEVVAAIIVHDDKILCMQRDFSKYDYISYTFEFPGGKVEQDESNSQALKRELFEEMEMDVNITEQNYYLTVTHNYPDFEITLHFYMIKVDNPYFIQKVHISHKWLKRDELATLNWAPADELIIERLIEEQHE